MKLQLRASMYCVGGNSTRKCCFRDPKFKHFPGGMPSELPRRCRHFCFMVLAPQPLQMSWPRSDHGFTGREDSRFDPNFNLNPNSIPITNSDPPLRLQKSYRVAYPCVFLLLSFFFFFWWGSQGQIAGRVYKNS